MSNLSRLYEYAQDFEVAVLANDWSLLERHFAEDARHIVCDGGPLDLDDRGLFRGLRRRPKLGDDRARATAKPSTSRARTPTESTNIRWPSRCLRIASAIGERIELALHANKTLPGRSSTLPGSYPLKCSTQISVNSRRAVLKSISTLPLNRSRSSSEPSLWRPRRPMSMASICDGVAVLMASK